jgi:hypothetical protein
MAKDYTVKVRVTQDELARIKGAAQAFGCPVAEYIRAAIRAHMLAPEPDDGRPTLMGISRREMGVLRRDMAAWGNNLNQVAHALNEGMVLLRAAREASESPCLRAEYGEGIEAMEWGLDNFPELAECTGLVMESVWAMMGGVVTEIPDAHRSKWREAGAAERAADLAEIEARWKEKYKGSLGPEMGGEA